MSVYEDDPESEKGKKSYFMNFPRKLCWENNNLSRSSRWVWSERKKNDFFDQKKKRTS